MGPTALDKTLICVFSMCAENVLAASSTTNDRGPCVSDVQEKRTDSDQRVDSASDRNNHQRCKPATDEVRAAVSEKHRRPPDVVGREPHTCPGNGQAGNGQDWQIVGVP